jgi:DNA-binding transcriptional regulator/RsmH inhibitor MraZ
MPFSIAKYYNAHEHKMDPKCRVAIPVAWRPEEGEELVLMQLTKRGVPMIRVLNNKAVEDGIQSIHNSGCTAGEIREALEEFYMNIHIVKVSSQGKILIPKDWCIRANIAPESSVYLAGKGDYFEIYNDGMFTAMATEQTNRVSKNMAHTNFFST